MIGAIFEKYAPLAKAKGREFLFRHDVAMRFLHDLKGTGAVIAGMDFYRDDGDHVMEMIGNGADYSDLVSELNAGGNYLGS